MKRLNAIAVFFIMASIFVYSPSNVRAEDIGTFRNKIEKLNLVEDKLRYKIKKQKQEISPSPEPSSEPTKQPSLLRRMQSLFEQPTPESSDSATPTQEPSPTVQPISLAEEPKPISAPQEKPDTIMSIDLKNASDSDVDLLLSKVQQLENEGKDVTYVDGGKVKTFFFFAYDSKEKLNELKNEFKDKAALKVVDNRRYVSQFTPNDPLYASQTNLSLIDYSGGLDIGGGTGRPVIAVLDNGVNVDETDINPNMRVKTADIYGNGIDDDGNGYIDDTYGCDFYKFNRSGGASSCLKASLFDSTCTNANSSCNHGLWVSEIAAAYTNNGYGMASICPICKILAVRIDDSTGAYISDIISGINYSVNEGANIINFSYTSTCPFDASGDVLNPYIDSAVNTYKVNYVQAAGNQGAMTQATCNSSCSGNPYCASSARNDAYYYIDGKSVQNKLIVATTDNNHGRASFSNYNSTNTQVNISAPGQSIPVALNGTSTTISGTSFSAPQVAGAVGLALSYLLPKYTPSPAEMVEIINNTGRKITTDQNISGRELYLSKVMQLAASRATVYGTNYVFVSRFWNPTWKTHFYTGSDREAVDLRQNYPDSTWTYEGTAFYAFGSQVTDTVPVYRFFSNKLSTYFYTANYDEKNEIIAKYPDNVWHYDGVVWYTYPLAYSGPSTTVFRFWSPSLGRHFYTSSIAERDYLRFNQTVYQYEGPVWKNP
jgi:hypothetical protein